MFVDLLSGSLLALFFVYTLYTCIWHIFPISFGSYKFPFDMRCKLPGFTGSKALSNVNFFSKIFTVL